MAEHNAQGLPRSIPAEVKRAVRQACGFGCVVCGSAIVEYEHVAPTFAEATSHDAARIALLCPQCHAKVTRKFLPKSQVEDALKNPFCKRQGFSSEVFEMGSRQPRFVFAGMTFESCLIPIEVRGTPLFTVQPAEVDGAPVRLSGTFHGRDGRPSLEIVDNEWRPSAANWDVEAAGGAITVRDGPGSMALRVRFELPDKIVVERVDMCHSGLRFLGNADKLEVIWPNGGRVAFTDCFSGDSRVGMSF